MENEQIRSVFVSYKNAAKELGVSRQTVRNWCRRGILKKYLVPGNERSGGITRESMDKLIVEATKRSIEESAQ